MLEVTMRIDFRSNWKPNIKQETRDKSLFFFKRLGRNVNQTISNIQKDSFILKLCEVKIKKHLSLN